MLTKSNQSADDAAYAQLKKKKHVPKNSLEFRRINKQFYVIIFYYMNVGYT